MDCQKTGKMIQKLRREKGLTQKELGERLHISDRTISKWERGKGYPEITLLPGLSVALGADIEKMLTGETEEQERRGNMKKVKFYICLVCGNIITALGDAAVSCCGRKIEAARPVRAEGRENVRLEQLENEWYISTDHPMKKTHYISFVAHCTEENMTLVKQYPEWDLQVRILKKHGTLYWYCTEHGLHYQLV